MEKNEKQHSEYELLQIQLKFLIHRRNKMEISKSVFNEERLIIENKLNKIKENGN